MRRPFASTDRFRVNGQGRRLDVWLIYACTHCGARWNRRLYQRVTPESLGDALDQFHRNDAELAQRVAFDRQLGGGLEMEKYVPFEVRGAGAEPAARPLVVEIGAVVAAVARLDAVVATGLGLSRRQLAQWIRCERIATHSPRAWRRPIRCNQQIRILA